MDDLRADFVRLLLLFSEQAHLSDHVPLVGKGDYELDVSTHFASEYLNLQFLLSPKALRALYSYLVPEHLIKRLVNDRFCKVCCQANILDEPLPLFVVLCPDGLILLVEACPILLVEEDLVLYDQDIFPDQLSFLSWLGLFSFDHGQVVQNDLAEVVRIFILKKLDVAVDQCEEVAPVQIEGVLRASRVLESDDSELILPLVPAVSSSCPVLGGAVWIDGVRDAERAWLLPGNWLSEMVTLEEVYHHPSIAHYVQTLPLNETEKVLSHVVIPERSGWAAHVERDINRIDLVEEPDVVSELLLDLELKIIHLMIFRRIQRVLELKQVLFEVRIISCLLECVE
jgi:hypothetical protein